MIQALAESQEELNQTRAQLRAKLSEELGPPIEQILSILDRTLEEGGVVNDEARQQLQRALCALGGQLQATHVKAASAAAGRLEV